MCGNVSQARNAACRNRGRAGSDSGRYAAQKKYPEYYFCSFIVRLCLLVFLPFSNDNLCPWFSDTGSIWVLYRQVSADEIFEKEIKSRPQEKISNIVLNVKAALVQDYSKKLKWILMAVAVAGSLLLFSKPRILYEQSEEGYYVRFYTYGLTNMTTATIPAAYQGEKVVGLRGNTFSNMPFLREVTLPDTLTEIRGQAFKNCGSLESVRLPEHLTYLGGEAFYHCTGLEEVNLPDGLTEIKGSTFEECSSLQRIEIPDNVTRIGGHAFMAISVWKR